MRRRIISLLPAAAIAAAAFPAHRDAGAQVRTEPADTALDAPFERAAATTGVDLAAWQQRRSELGLGALGLADTALDAGTLTDAIERLQEAGLLAPERALLAELASDGVVNPGVANEWDALLRDADASRLDRTALFRGVLHRTLVERGSLAAALPLACLPARDGADELAAFLQAEALTPWWRPRAPTERAPDVAGTRYPVLARALALLGPVAPPVVDAPSTGQACDDSFPELIAALVHASVAEFAAVEPALRAVAATRRLPPRLLLRPAVAAYVRADAHALDVLTSLCEGSREGGLIAALAAATSTDPSAYGDTITALPEPADAVEYWVRGELARRAGRWDNALSDLERAIQRDPLFAPALLSRASALIAAGRASDALADLHHLRLTYPGDSPYATLIDALERRLR